MPNFVPGVGASDAKLMIVGEAPGKVEDEKCEPLVGPTGQQVKELLESSGMMWHETYRTNVHKYRPPDNNLYRYKELGIDEKWERDLLIKEVRTIAPNVILALGNESLKALTGKSGILKYRGSILESFDNFPKVIPTIHPAALSYQGSDGDFKMPYSAMQYIRHDFKRAITESTYKEFKLPNRVLQVCHGANDLFNFLRTYSDKRELSVDIEALRCIPTCIGLAFSPHHAISVPLWNVPSIGKGLRLSENDLDEIWVMLIKLLNDPEIKIIGQNFKYDHEKLIFPTGLMKPRRIYTDTTILASVVHPELPRNLAFLASIYTREPYYKDEYADFDPSIHTIERILSYNAKDVAVTFEVYLALDSEIKKLGLVDYCYNYKMRLHDVYMKMESRGLNADKDRKKELIDKYTKLAIEGQKKLNEIIGYEINIKSPKQVAKALFQDLKLPLRASTDEDTIVGLLGNHATDGRKEKFLSGVLDQRRYSKTLSTYLTILPDYDGKIRTSYRIAGTETGRTSTSNLEPPLRPTFFMGKRKKDKKDVKKALGFASQTATKHGDIGADFRSIFVPDPGHVFLEVDLSQAEARIVALLSNDDELLRLFDTKDVHSLTASWFFNVSIENITKEMRFIGKTGRHAGAYDAGKRRLMMTINSDARRFGINTSVSEWKAGQILETFHKFSPNIRGVFHRDIIAALTNNNRVLIGPYGGRRQFLNRWGDGLFKEAFAHIPQHTVSEKTHKAMIELNDNYDLDMLLESHDALLFQVLENEVDDVVKTVKPIFEEEIDFSNCSLPRGKLKIPVEFQIGYNYKDLKKYEIK